MNGMEGLADIFSRQGGAIMAVMAEALANARINGCDCGVCSALRASQGAMDTLVRGDDIGDV